MELILKAAAIAAAGAAVSLAVKRSNPELALLLAAAAALFVLYSAMSAVDKIVELTREIAAAAGISGAALSAVLKTVGIAIVSRLAADVCRDAGQSSAASAVETAGAAGALYAALPLMRAVMETVGRLT